MQPMTEAQRAAVLYMVLCLLTFTWFITYCSTEHERMALAGFMPYRMPGDSSTYWLPIPLKEPKQDPIRSY